MALIFKEAQNAAPTEDGKRTRLRSPAYPFLSLDAALKRAKKFYDEEQRNAAPLKVAAKHWGYEEKSSGAAQTAATLISYGLMEDEGTGDKRKLRLSKRALRILLDERPVSPERDNLIKEAALAPKVHQELWKRWGANLPSTDSLKHTLMFDWQPPFNPASVDGFIKEYRATIAFAKLSESDSVSAEVKDKGEGEYVAKIGDYVQWEHNGVLGFPEPKRVTGISPDGNYAYVDGQYGAVPMNELLCESVPATLAPPDPSLVQRIQSPSKTHMQEFVVPLSDGSKAVFQWPSSLSSEDVADLKDSLKIVERKISRSQAGSGDAEKPA